VRIAIKREAGRPPVFCLLLFIFMFSLQKTQERKQKENVVPQHSSSLCSDSESVYQKFDYVRYGEERICDTIVGSN
jgi:hypothetical protein